MLKKSFYFLLILSTISFSEVFEYNENKLIDLSMYNNIQISKMPLKYEINNIKFNQEEVEKCKIVSENKISCYSNKDFDIIIDINNKSYSESKIINLKYTTSFSKTKKQNTDSESKRTKNKEITSSKISIKPLSNFKNSKEDLSSLKKENEVLKGILKELEKELDMSKKIDNQQEKNLKIKITELEENSLIKEKEINQLKSDKLILIQKNSSLNNKIQRLENLYLETKTNLQRKEEEIINLKEIIELKNMMKQNFK